MNQTLNILYVDDEEDIRTIVEFALEDEPDFRLTVCASGPEALRLLPELKANLILLDVMMPGMDGPATLSALRNLPGHADTPVVFITAKVQPHEVSQLLALGAAAVIAKPFDPLSLPDQIRSVRGTVGSHER